MSDKTRILIFTGEGKGKSTAALGMALRASGHGMKVCVVQFIKSSDATGEAMALKGHPLITLHRTGHGFVPPASDPRWAKHHSAAAAGLTLAQAAVTGGDCDVLVLDEICVAVAKGLVDEAAVIALLGSARPGMNVVLTGRDATPGLIAMADTVTEMRCIKHGFQAGRPAKKGVEL